MTILAIILVALGTLFVFPYAIYPLLLRIIPGRPFQAGGLAAERLPRVSVLVPAYDEATHIERKLRNTLALDYPRDRLEVLVCSDGSTDGTAERAEAFAGEGVKVLRNERNLGKAATLNRLVGEAKGELLLLTDASAELDPGALRRLVGALADPEVGVACARYVVRADPEGHGAETGYWDVEARVRRAEAERDLLVGASGAAYVIRRSLVEALPADTVNDDYVLPLRARATGHRVAYVHDAIASDRPTARPTELYYRWRRIAFGNYQMLWRHRRLFRDGRLALPLTRKLLRTAGPLLLASALLLVLSAALWKGTFGLLETSTLFALTIGGISAALPDRGVGRVRPIRLIRFATLSQLAYLVGALRFLVGRAGAWRHATPPIDFERPAPVPLSVRAAKRALDILSALVALTLLSPVLLAVAVLIRLDSKGPVLYTQTRLCPGPDGRPVEFTMIKFRSMRTEAEANTGPVWAAKDDDRVTRLGRFLRKHRLDELPQFINILKGDMSLVGPRPERQFYVDQFVAEIPGYNDRHMVLRPGLTGWAQVQCGYDASTQSVREKLAHDLAYVAHLYRLRTYLRMELKILFRTVRVVLTGKGAH